MRRFFEVIAVVILATLSSIFAVLAVLFPAPGVRLLFKKLAISLSNAAKRV